MEWGTWFLKYIEKIMKQNSKDAPVRRATTAEQAVMNAFGIEQSVAEWLIDALKQEGYEIRPLPDSL